MLIYIALERERVLLDAINHLRHRDVQRLCPPDYPEQTFYCVSCDLAEESTRALWKTLSSN